MITARGKKAKDLGALGSSWINEHYTNGARNQDFMGQPEKANPDYAPARKPYADPLKFAVVESAEMLARRKQLQWVAAFRNHVQTRERIESCEISQETPRYPRHLAPLQHEVDAWKIDTKAEAERHRAFIAKEKAEMDARRLAHALRA